MRRSFSTRGRPGDFTGEGFSPGFPGYGRNVIRLPESSYTGDPGPFWRKTVRGRFGEEILLVQSAMAGTDPETELGTETGDAETTPAMSGTSPTPAVFEAQVQAGAADGLPLGPVETGQSQPELSIEKETGAKTQSQSQGAHGPEVAPEPLPELKPQREAERKPLIWKGFPK